MPILIMGVIALIIFVGIGLLLFSASIAESHTRNHPEAREESVHKAHA